MNIFNRNDHQLVLLHFEETLLQEVLDGARPRQSGDDASRHPIDWYCHWAVGAVGSVHVLVPERLRSSMETAFPWPGPTAIIWYEADGSLTLPPLPGDVGCWVINGNQMPIVNWDAAEEAAARHRCDVLVFGPPGAVSSAQYPESLVVDASGQVQKVERHYFDSPAFTDVAFGPATFLFAAGPSTPAIIAHLLKNGWNLASIHALSDLVRVEWCAAPGVLSSLAGLVRGNGRTHAPWDSTATDPRGKDSAPGSNPARGEGAAVASHTHARPRYEERRRPSSPRDPSASTTSDPSAPAAGAVSAGAWMTQEFRGDWGYRTAKRALDIAASSLGLLVHMPFFLVVAALIKLTSRGPVLYGDLRQGLGGREFRCLKFRTMVADAAQKQRELQSLNEVDGPQFKISDDPRLTPIGHWLRRYNIDELPQLWNVLMGEMSLVGPRPSPDRENQLCPGWRRTRLSVRPGITGLWQVLRLRNAGTSDFQEWIYYDVEYARHQSLWLDLLILLYTPITIFAPHRVVRLAQRLARRGICVESGRIHRDAGMAHAADSATAAT